MNAYVDVNLRVTEILMHFYMRELIFSCIHMKLGV